MSRVGPWLMLLVIASLAVVGCANVDRTTVQPDTVVLPTPIHSFGASMTSTIDAVERAVTAAGSRIAPAGRPYRPSEPESLLQVPRVVLRADLADADDGFVVVYQLRDAAAASSQGRGLADYLGSGFGQTNFGPDTQFSVRRAGDTVIFTSWSRQRSSDPTRAEAVFDAVSGVGEEIEVRK